MNTIDELVSHSTDVPAAFCFGAQVQSCTQRVTKSQKPYYELELVDASQKVRLKIWDNHPQFPTALGLSTGAFLKIDGQFSKGSYGIEPKQWSWSPLSEEEKATLLLGSPSLAAKQDEDWKTILHFLASIGDPRLHRLCALFVEQYEEKFRRAAAAKSNHHARRGGLVEHVSQMMRSASKLCDVYQDQNRDLLITGILFHDCGKMWENNYLPDDFHQLHNLTGEALGHISLGIELTNKLWKKIHQVGDTDQWQSLSPPSEHLRLHLLHLIASHHGSLEFGSPVVPKTPEAFLLHYIDNIDAKLEMLSQAYQTGVKLSNHLTEKKFPLPGNLITPIS